MKMLAAPEVWRKVHRAAQRQEKAMRTAVIRLFSSEIPGLEKALVTGRESVVEQCVAAAWVGPLDRATRAIRNSLLTALVDGGEAQAALTTPSMRAAERSRNKVNIGFAFDQTSPEAIAWAQKHAGELVTNLSVQQRKNVRQLVTDAFAKQQTTKQLAAQLKDVVGLTGPQFSKYQRLLAENQRAAQVYAKKAWQARAVTIARTETLRASNEGQRQAWNQATKQGLLSGQELREWITTYDDRTCPICAPMDGQLTGLKEGFKLPDGSSVSGPPAHVKCRCAQGISAKTRSSVKGSLEARTLPDGWEWYDKKNAISPEGEIVPLKRVPATNPPPPPPAKTYVTSWRPEVVDKTHRIDDLTVADGERGLNVVRNEMGRLEERFAVVREYRPDVLVYDRNDTLSYAADFASKKTSELPLNQAGGLYTPATISTDGRSYLHVATGKWRETGVPFADGSWIVDDSIAGRFRHELGHHIHLTALPTQAREEFKALLYEEKVGISSVYGRSNEFEAFAESFSLFTHVDYGTLASRRLDEKLEAFFLRWVK